MAPKVSEDDLKAFSKRLHDACIDNSKIPDLNHGLYTFISARMTELGIRTSYQGVRKWFHGESIPTRVRIRLLAEIVDVDPVWLAVGRHEDDIKPSPPRVLAKHGA